MLESESYIDEGDHYGNFHQRADDRCECSA